MIPERLAETMSRWKPTDARNPQSDIPKLLYTIPNGVNPTGSSLTEQRKAQIYQVYASVGQTATASCHELMI